ncbi:MAG: GNAT family N-acetyltransferase [Terracidiphilus sp.]|jgi:aminoglycoside 6'-N-acetyltransferase I
MAVLDIRQARAEDRIGLAEMRTMLWPDSATEEHLREIDANLNGTISSTLPCTIFVAQEGSGELSGFLEVGLRSHADGCDPSRPVGFVEGWFVRDGHRNQGVGRALMRAAEEWARAHACHEIASDALVDNVESLDAHQALGFEIVDCCVHFRKSL